MRRHLSLGLSIGVVLIVSMTLLTALAGAAPKARSADGDTSAPQEAPSEVTSPADSGPGTLRAAIAAAGTGLVRISFAPDLHQIVLASPITIANRKVVALVGPGANRLEISGADRSRMLTIDPGALVMISGLTFAHGRALGTSDDPGNPGEGGAIYNGGNTNLEDVTFASNLALGGPSPVSQGGAGRGGAIFNTDEGRLKIDHVLFRDDEARGSNEHDYLRQPRMEETGGEAFGGAIYNESTSLLQIDRSEFSADTARGGNGIGVNFVFAYASTSGGNAFGGAIYNGAKGWQVKIAASTFVRDSALGGHVGGPGGTVDPGGDAAGGAIFSAADGIRNQEFSLRASTLVDDVAIAGENGNQFSQKRPPRLGAGAVELRSGYNLLNSDTIAFDRGSADVQTAQPAYASNDIFGSCAGAGVLSFDFNIDYGNGCKLDRENDLPNTNAGLGPLGNHGGPTQTMLPGRVAIDVGNTALESVDQRGLPREVRTTTKPEGPGNESDIGAVEVQVPPPTPQTRFELRPAKLGFGAVRVGTVSRFLEVSLDNTGDLPFDVGAVKVTGKDIDEFSISSETCAGTRVAPTASCRVRVRFSPEEEGAQSAEIKIDAKVPGGPLVVPLEGAGAEDHHADPSGNPEGGPSGSGDRPSA